MRFAGLLARDNAMMSFSRSTGTFPSISRRVRWLALVMTHSPTMTRSFGLSSIFRAMSLPRRGGAMVVDDG
jgi:hypothetical protein